MIMLMRIIVIIIIVFIFERPQKVLESPAGHLPALLPRRFVRKAEVDALVDAGVDHFLPRIREAIERARVLDGRSRVGGRH